MTKNKNKLYPIEAALLLGLCLSLLMGVAVRSEQRALAEKVVRLHVIAVSDSPEDQAVKLRVRDAVLAELTPRLEGICDAGEAGRVIESALPELRALAEEVSGGAAEAVLGREVYPTREYETFSLPAGEYTSLRIVLGEGKGHNWWCVVYPPLCTATVTDALKSTAALSEGDVKLITGDGEGYVLKFRLMEWWGELLHRAEFS